MWKHEIIADLRKQRACNLTINYSRWIDALLPGLETAPVIHLGTTEALSSANKILGDEEPYIFTEKGSLLHFPFEKTLFTFTPSQPYIVGIPRAAVFVEQDIHDSKIRASSFFYNPVAGVWMLLPYAYFCNAVQDSMQYLYNPGLFMNWVTPNEVVQDINIRLVQVVHAAVYTLNARNVYLDAVEPLEKLNKKRLKKRKIPLFRYHVLKLAPGAIRKDRNHGCTQPVIGSMPVYLCRGHFKHYTDDAPLFGIPGNCGRFWVQAHVRGNKKNGIVLKDYELKE